MLMKRVNAVYRFRLYRSFSCFSVASVSNGNAISIKADGHAVFGWWLVCLFLVKYVEPLYQESKIELWQKLSLGKLND